MNQIENYVAPVICEPIIRIPLTTSNKETAAVISGYSSHLHPMSLEEIIEGQWKPKGPVFLLEMPDEGICPYPVDTYASTEDGLYQERLNSSSDSLSLKKFFPSEYWDNPRLFGTPTRLKIDPLDSPPPGALYTPDDGRFYKMDYIDLKWYLIGSKDNYQRFINASKMTLNSLLKFIGIDFESEGFGTLEPNQEIPEITSEEARREIQDFLTWLKRFDPDLWRQVGGIVNYAPHYSGDSCSFIQNTGLTWPGLYEQFYPESKGVWAYFDPYDGEVYLLPATVALLKRKEYRQAAAVLIHENTHRVNRSAGLVSPSEQLAVTGIIKAAAALNGFSLDEGLSIFTGRGLWRKFGDYHRFAKSVTNLLCHVLHILPEEEKSAFLAEILYSAPHWEENDNTAFYNDALAQYAFYDEAPISQSSLEGMSLSDQYILLSHQTALATHEEKRIFDVLFINSLKDHPWTFFTFKAAMPIPQLDSPEGFLNPASNISPSSTADFGNIKTY